MVIKGIIKKGEYFDSVSLMIVAKTVNQLGDGIESAVVMGTRENMEILKTADLLLPEFAEAGDTDLLIAIKAENEKEVDDVLRTVEDQLKKLREGGDSGEDFNPSGIEGALKVLPEANLALISVAGKYAACEARKALDNGLHVMIFSDNVALEDEIQLKTLAREKGLLVMGPDCGTAILNGTPLAFANVVNTGGIGVVAASGTGLQEVTCLISNAGEGISQAIGTGGRDIKTDVGGITFIQALQALAEDEETKVLLLVSKPPHKEVLEKIAQAARKIDKPIAALFLGAQKEELEKYGFEIAHNLEEAAALAVKLLRKEDKGYKQDSKVYFQSIAKKESSLAAGQKYLRAIYSGGTFCSEAQVILANTIEGIHSNAPHGNSIPLEDLWKSCKHTIIDVGEDEFTRGKPHPMIDYSYRNRRILEEAEDPETAVILLDVVLGYGSNLDPLSELVPVITRAREIAKKNGRYLPFICSVTGTDRDPQNRSTVVKGLENIGAVILASNADACEVASIILNQKGA
ncbi:MAG: acyl-CoA synthetase FdrA [bacterium]|nr:acyl-CoA synthetase FdrA [bacterium]